MKYTIYDQWRLWESVKWTNPTVSWRSGWIENGFCPECRLCCGPQPGDEPFPMALLPKQIYPGIEKVFYMYDSTHASLDERGCKALGERGCMEVRENRPPACGLFPIVLGSGQLYLYTVCPASIFLPISLWFNLGQKVKDWLLKFSISDLKHLNIDIPESVLTDRYVDLHLKILE